MGARRQHEHGYGVRGHSYAHLAHACMLCVAGETGWVDCTKTAPIDSSNLDQLAMIASFGATKEQSGEFRFTCESCSTDDLHYSVGDTIHIEGPAHFARAHNRTSGTPTYLYSYNFIILYF